MESRDSVTPDEARAALQELTGAQERIAAQVVAPWWYRLGAALCTASLFVGMGLVVGQTNPSDAAETASSLLIVLGAVVAPIALLAGLKRSTGVSVDRYSQGMGVWYVIVFGLLAIAFVLQQFAGVPFALAAGGVGAFIATVFNERRIDALLGGRVRTGRWRS